MQTDEERLVESAIGGDAYAFEQLMGKHEARMYAGRAAHVRQSRGRAGQPAGRDAAHI